MIDNKGKQNFRNIKRGYAKSKIDCQFVHFLSLIHIYPGPMEYRGVYLLTGQEVFHFGPVYGTNSTSAWSPT